MGRCLALLRGVNVAGRNKVPMARLREVCEGLGWKDVDTYIQSGNVVFSSTKAVATLKRELEGVLSESFDVAVPVVVCQADRWRRIVDANPYPAAAQARPNLLHACIAQNDVKERGLDVVRAKLTGDEDVDVAAGVIWMDYANGAGRSKVTPAVLDKAAGEPVTARNWKTVVRLGEMLAGER